MGMTDEQAVQAAWDENVAAVQAAKTAIRDAQLAYTAACDRFASVVAPLRRRMMTGRCTDDEVSAVEAAEATVEAARQAKVDAVAELEVARARFKAGVTADQTAKARKGH